jgi:hypothetical protein
MVASPFDGRVGRTVPAANRKTSDIRIDRISFGYDEHSFRAPVGFAGAVSRGHDGDGAVFGSHRRRESRQRIRVDALQSHFSFPSKTLSNETKNDAMKALAAELAEVTGSYGNLGIRSTSTGSSRLCILKAAAEVSDVCALADPIPKLCTLVTAAAFDAAIHDALARRMQINCFDSYGPEFMTQDLSRYLGAEYKENIPATICFRGTRRA